MADNLSVPNAPLSHPNSIEHRRLIAARANQDVTEQGVFTPAFDFATTGDLANSAVTADGDFWRIGRLVHFSFRLQVTPTFTTASGAARVGGFPYVLGTGLPTMIFPVRLDGANVTWPAGLTSIVGFMRADEDWTEVAFQGTGATGANMLAADITSANSLTLFMSGFYPI